MNQRHHRVQYYSDSSLSSSLSSESSESDSSNSTSDSSVIDVEMYQPSTKKQKTSKNCDLETKLHHEYISKLTYKWVIKDFHKVSKESSCGEKIESPVLNVGTNNEFEFQFYFYPKGMSEANRNYLGISLLLRSSNEPQSMVTFKCSPYNDKFPKKPIEVKEFVSQGRRISIKHLMKVLSLHRDIGFIQDGSIILNCDVELMLSKIDDHKMKIVDDVGTLLNSGDHSDVILELQDRKFMVHRCILAARSDVFSAMFKYEMPDQEPSTVKITDIRPEVMEEVLRFVYSGKIQNLANSTEELLAAAEKYNFADLKKLCEVSIAKNLCVGNVVEILNFAELHNAGILKTQALDFFTAHVKDVVNTPSFQIMANKESPLLAQIIQQMALQKAQ